MKIKQLNNKTVFLETLEISNTFRKNGDKKNVYMVIRAMEKGKARSMNIETAKFKDFDLSTKVEQVFGYFQETEESYSHD